MATADIKLIVDEDKVRKSIDKYINNFEVEFTASGRKSSEGDGRTAADIEKELKSNGS